MQRKYPEMSERWETLKDWGDDVELVQALKGGMANDVWSVRLHGTAAVARLGNRSDEDLLWEAELLQFLHHKGLSVPTAIPTRDGRLFSRGLMLMSYMKGRAPESKSDWSRVATTLTFLHEITRSWPQRPGWKSSIDLIETQTGTKVNLNEMPVEAVKKCRAAWRRLQDYPQSVIHGDSNNSGNVLISGNTVSLIDWDEAHVDVSVLDLVLPENAADLDTEGVEFDHASQASAAWEAAVCWDDAYSKRRLSEVRD